MTRSSEESSDHYNDDRCDNYSFSADMSESDSSSMCNGESASSSIGSSPLARGGIAGSAGFPAPVMFPVVGGKDVVVSKKVTEKLETNLSGKHKDLSCRGT